jgi:hypothetical protein
MNMITLAIVLSTDVAFDFGIAEEQEGRSGFARPSVYLHLASSTIMRKPKMTMAQSVWQRANCC